MEIKTTKKAKELIDFYSWVNFPETMEECFDGFKSITDNSAPDIWEGLRHLDKQLSAIKESYKSKINDIISGYKDLNILSPINYNLDYLLANISVVAATYYDIANSTPFDVNNIFTTNQEKIKIENTTPYNIGQGLLGVYRLDTGSITIFVDKILQYDNPELILQLTLVHEFIHAMLDICPRIIEKEKSAILGKVWSEEESLSNLLNIEVLTNSECHNVLDIKDIQGFFNDQNYPYRITDEENHKDKIILIQADFQNKLEDIPHAIRRYETNSDCKQDMYGYNLDYVDDPENQKDENSINPTWFNDLLNERLAIGNKKNPDEKIRKKIGGDIRHLFCIIKRMDYFDNLIESSLLLQEYIENTIEIGNTYPFGEQLIIKDYENTSSLSLSVVIQDSNVVNANAVFPSPAYKAIIDFQLNDNRFLLSYTSGKNKPYEIFLTTDSEESDYFIEIITEVGKDGSDFYRLLKDFFISPADENIQLSRGFPSNQEIKNAISNILKEKDTQH